MLFLYIKSTFKQNKQKTLESTIHLHIYILRRQIRALLSLQEGSRLCLVYSALQAGEAAIFIEVVLCEAERRHFTQESLVQSERFGHPVNPVTLRPLLVFGDVITERFPRFRRHIAPFDIMEENIRVFLFVLRQACKCFVQFGQSLLDLDAPASTFKYFSKRAFI